MQLWARAFPWTYLSDGETKNCPAHIRVWESGFNRYAISLSLSLSHLSLSFRCQRTTRDHGGFLKHLSHLEEVQEDLTLPSLQHIGHTPCTSYRPHPTNTRTSLWFYFNCQNEWNRLIVIPDFTAYYYSKIRKTVIIQYKGEGTSPLISQRIYTLEPLIRWQHNYWRNGNCPLFGGSMVTEHNDIDFKVCFIFLTSALCVQMTQVHLHLILTQICRTKALSWFQTLSY